MGNDRPGFFGGKCHGFFGLWSGITVGGVDMGPGFAYGYAPASSSEVRPFGPEFTARLKPCSDTRLLIPRTVTGFPRARIIDPLAMIATGDRSHEMDSTTLQGMPQVYQAADANWIRSRGAF
jgi:hypothetical protein